jgi:diguanylate cyclase (GGDEF)-like protein
MATGPVGLLVIDAGGRVVHSNPAAGEILRRDVTASLVTDLIHLDDLPRIMAASRIRTWDESTRGPGSVWRMTLPDGGSVEIVAHSASVEVDGTTFLQLGFLPAPPRLAVLTTLEDVASLRPLVETFAALMEGIVNDGAGLAINWVDPEGRVHLFGNLSPLLGGVTPDGVRDPDPTTPWFEAAAGGVASVRSGLEDLRPEVADAARDAGYVGCCVSPIADPATGLALLYVSWVRDRSHLAYLRQTFDDVLADVLQVALDRAEDARQLRYAAHHDQLTGLGNRRAFFDTLTVALAEGAVSILYLDLDDFKRVNDKFGHDAGDRALVAVAERLRATAPAHALVARLGGDEFAIVVPDADGADAQALAVRVVAEMGRPLALERYGEVSVGVSVGFSVTDGRSPPAPNALVLAADEALRAAKGDGKGTWVRAATRQSRRHPEQPKGS